VDVGCDYDAAGADNDPCNDDLFCTKTDECDGGSCVGTGETCDDDNECTDDLCDDDLNECTNACNASSPFEPCCEDAACSSDDICQAGGVINIGDFWANCGDVGVKIHICLENLNIPVGGFQMDLCENPDRRCAGMSDLCEDDSDCLGSVTGKTYDVPCQITGADPDCLICVECEMTERTVLFDCVVNELPNGCCRVILFSKNPGGLINPGECDIVTIVYEISDAPECCDECIEIDGMGIIVTDEYGYDILAVIGETGEVCPYECGDIEPGCASLVCSNNSSLACVDDSDCGGGFPTPTCSVCAPGVTCGDGDVDIFDILLEVDFALDAKRPDSCQAGSRSNVPTGTPPNCLNPDGTIDILDGMVIIDMALDRQDCCTYYYGGIIY